MSPNARSKALAVLNDLQSGRGTLDRLLDRHLGKNVFDDRRERALANALIFGVVRWRARIDWVLGYFSKTPLAKIEPPVLNILRLGAYQILHLDRIPSCAAVHTSVELAKNVSAPWTVKFVNALLRNIIRQHASVPWPDPKADPILHLSTRKSFAPWMLKRWMVRFGPSETARLCDALNTIPPISLRVNTLKTDRDTLAKALAADVKQITPTAFSPDGLALGTLPASVEDLPCFDAGWFQVQDEAAQLITYLLKPQPGERVLDACAGLGGKTAHAAQLMQNQGEIMAVDTAKTKLRILKGEMKRLGIGIVDTQRLDITRDLSSCDLPRFDRVLVDAPCSGMGVMRRNPDTKWSASKKKLDRNSRKQFQLLDKAAALVKPGGILVYAVCSYEPEENEGVVHRFLKKHPQYVVDAAAGDNLKPVMDTENGPSSLRCLPHRHCMDGFFGIRLRRMQV